jgi:hypothetical protein
MSTTQARQRRRRNEAHQAVDEAYENGDIDQYTYEMIQEDVREDPDVIVVAAKTHAEEYL